MRLSLLSALSGSAWGLLASYLLTDGRMGSGASAIVAASLPIGIVMGLAARRFSHLPIIVRCLYALVSLYLDESPRFNQDPITRANRNWSRRGFSPVVSVVAAARLSAGC